MANVFGAVLILCAAVTAIPVLPLSIAASWPAPNSGLYRGDLRAVVTVSDATEVNSLQIFWRRRDNNPADKGVIVTDVQDNAVPVTVEAIELGCGLVSFTPTAGPGIYYVYFMPYWQTGGGANLHFHWFNCTSQSPACVLSPQRTRIADSVCSAVLPPPPSVAITGLETRPSPALADKPDFHAFTSMELSALPVEMDLLFAAYPAAQVMLFAEQRTAVIRMFNLLAASWAARGPDSAFADSPMAGEYYTFQAGVFAARGNASNLTVVVSDLQGPGGAVIPSSAVHCVNLGGNDEHGKAFDIAVSVPQGMVQPLWFGFAAPSTTAAMGLYHGTLHVSSADGAVVVLSLTFNVTMPASGQPLPNNNFGDVYSMSRLAWLDSMLGLDDAVAPQFAPVLVNATKGALSVTLVNKIVDIGADGFLAQATVSAPKVSTGKKVLAALPVLQQPLQFTVFGANGAQLPMSIAAPTAVTSLTNTTVSFAAVHEGAGLTQIVAGTVECDSYMLYNVTLVATQQVTLGDIQLSMVTPATTRYMSGMGGQGGFVAPQEWRWEHDMTALCCGDNMVWLGRIDAGIFLKLKGEGDDWNSPMYDQDAPVIPFVPPSWGGVAQLNGQYGCNVSISGAVVCFSGPRVLAAGASITFLFDVAITPSKNLDMASHYRHRYFQVGYGTPYLSPQEVHATGVTVVTLHQGIPGIINGTIVNPYINYPFTPLTVEFLENYTQQAHALNMSVKFYYTIRELSNHAVELYALKSLNGEILTDTSAYVIPQTGYCHDYDCHGGEAYLHQHLVDNYTSCWQQNLPSGEWDAAVCDRGSSRWINYYINGLYTSVASAPHVNGLYYDGINFDRLSMRRVRNVLEQAAAAAHSTSPLVDIHTGFDSQVPPSVSYLSHFPYANRAWNGEGFDFGASPDYWLVDVSGFMHGITADRLGGGDDFKGLLYATTQRNSDSAPAIWKFWDQYNFQDTTLVGYWEDVPLVTLSTSSHGTNISCYTAYHGSYPEACGGADANIGFGGTCGGSVQSYPALTKADALAVCCQLGSKCAGFSISNAMDAQGRGTGCFKINTNCGVVQDSSFSGFAKPAPSACSTNVSDGAPVLATVFSAYQSHAIVVVASWFASLLLVALRFCRFVVHCRCGAATNVTLSLDWLELGLSVQKVVATLPPIPGVQAGSAASVDPSQPFEVAAGGGFILTLQQSD